MFHGVSRHRFRASIPRFALAVASAVAVVAGATGVALAKQAYTDSIAGLEIAYTSSQGTFTGEAQGALPGLWEAVVNHTADNGGPMTITGGSLTLYSRVHGHATTIIADTITGGSATPISGTSGCTDETYGVSATLAGEPFSGGFEGTLVHYKAYLFNQCITYAASLTGTLDLTKG